MRRFRKLIEPRGEDAQRNRSPITSSVSASSHAENPKRFEPKLLGITRHLANPIQMPEICLNLDISTVTDFSIMKRVKR